MDVSRTEHASWSLEGTSATMRGGVELKVDAVHPDHGLRHQSAVGRPSTTRLLCVHQENEGATAGWPLTLADVYVRGDDLIASYLPSPDCPFSPQLYWQAHPLNACKGVVESASLLVSFQTHLLDTHPQIGVSSQLESEEVLHLTADSKQVVNAGAMDRNSIVHPTYGISCVIYRIAGQTLSYAEFVTASDFQTLRVRHDHMGAPQAYWQMFAEFLEKGVIRKARVHAAFIERANDVPIAAACCEAIERSALPLTT